MHVPYFSQQKLLCKIRGMDKYQICFTYRLRKWEFFRFSSKWQLNMFLFCSLGISTLYLKINWNIYLITLIYCYIWLWKKGRFWINWINLLYFYFSSLRSGLLLNCSSQHHSWLAMMTVVSRYCSSVVPEGPKSPPLWYLPLALEEMQYLVQV